MFLRLSSATITAMTLAVAATGCGDLPALPPTATAPTPTPPLGPRPTAPFGPTGTFTLSGIVFETTTDGRHPVSGASVGIDVNIPNLWYYFGRTTSDDNGRYSMPRLPEGLIDAWASREGYAQPCFTSVRLRGDAVLDIELMSAATLALPNPPLPSTATSPTLSGLVFETTPEGIRPINAAQLTLEVGDGRGVSTFSNGRGRYFFCRVPPSVELWAEAARYANRVERVRVSEDTVFDVELKRR